MHITKLARLKLWCTTSRFAKIGVSQLKGNTGVQCYPILKQIIPRFKKVVHSLARCASWLSFRVSSVYVCVCTSVFRTLMEKWFSFIRISNGPVLVEIHLTSAVYLPPTQVAYKAWRLKPLSHRETKNPTSLSHSSAKSTLMNFKSWPFVGISVSSCAA